MCWGCALLLDTASTFTKSDRLASNREDWCNWEHKSCRDNNINILLNDIFTIITFIKHSAQQQPALETQSWLIDIVLDNVVSGYLCPDCPLQRTLPQPGQLCSLSGSSSDTDCPRKGAVPMLGHLLRLKNSVGVVKQAFMQIMVIFSKWMVPLNGQRRNYFPIKHLSLQGLN